MCDHRLQSLPSDLRLFGGKPHQHYTRCDPTSPHYEFSEVLVISQQQSVVAARAIEQICVGHPRGHFRYIGDVVFSFAEQRD